MKHSALLPKSLAVLLPMAFALAAAGFAGQTPTAEQSLSWKTVSNAKISPDGSMIAYTTQETDWKDNEFRTQIWIMRTRDKTAYELTSAAKSSSSPEWSRDGRRIAFLSERVGGKAQVFVIDPQGGEAVQLTHSETSVIAFHWSPDGSMIAYTAADAESKEHKQRKEKYGEFEIVQQDDSMVHLWWIAVPAEQTAEESKAERLTEGSIFSVGPFNWAPDSKRIAFSAAHDPELGSAGTSDIYVIALDQKTATKIVQTRGPDTNPLWSPDGEKIAYETSNGEEANFYKTSRIAVVTPGGSPVVVTPDFDENPRLLDWGPDGIYFGAMEKTAEHLFRADPATHKVTRLSANDHTIAVRPSFTHDFKQAASICSAPNEFAEVCDGPLLAAYQPVPLTHMRDQLQGFDIGTREVVQWKSKDGTKIEGILLKPVGFDPSHKYPLLVVIHGGPTGIDRPDIAPDRYYPVERFLAKGAVVLRPNYRGSAGYGEKFRSLNVRNLGLGDYDDVISGVDYLIGKGFVDRDRVGAMGWSQGGYISAFITCYSDRFRAVSVGAGISDWMTYYVNTDIHPFTRQYLKATPWEDWAIYRKTSPISYVERAKTPTLIQHGELDKRVPIPNAYELYQALQDRGVPVRMVVYKGFGHGITKPKQQLHLLEQNYEWFSQYVWGEKPAGGASTISVSDSPR
ncbi:MAG TPA: S9 family peptidase [Bryobacteraceae bacterium]